MAAPSTRNIVPLLPAAAETPSDYTVINGKLSTLTAGASTVDPLTYKDNVSLTPSEVAALLTSPNVFVTLPVTSSGTQLRLIIKRVIRNSST